MPLRTVSTALISWHIMICRDLAYNRSQPTSLLFAVYPQSVQFLGIQNKVRKMGSVLRRQVTCDEHVKLCGEDHGWREVSEQGFWGLVREEQRGVPLGFKVLGE